LTISNITSKISQGAKSRISETPEVPDSPDTPVIPEQLEVPDNQQTLEVADWPVSP
jgi:hypothetical protein